MAERTMFAEWLGEQLHARRLNRAQLAAYMQRPQSTVASWFNDFTISCIFRVDRGPPVTDTKGVPGRIRSLPGEPQ